MTSNHGGSHFGQCSAATASAATGLQGPEAPGHLAVRVAYLAELESNKDLTVKYDGWGGRSWGWGWGRNDCHWSELKSDIVKKVPGEDDCQDRLEKASRLLLLQGLLLEDCKGGERIKLLHKGLDAYDDFNKWKRDSNRYRLHDQFAIDGLGEMDKVLKSWLATLTREYQDPVMILAVLLLCKKTWELSRMYKKPRVVTLQHIITVLGELELRDIATHDYKQLLPNEELFSEILRFADEQLRSTDEQSKSAHARCHASVAVMCSCGGENMQLVGRCLENLRRDAILKDDYSIVIAVFQLRCLSQATQKKLLRSIKEAKPDTASKILQGLGNVDIQGRKGIIRELMWWQNHLHNHKGQLVSPDFWEERCQTLNLFAAVLEDDDRLFCELFLEHVLVDNGQGLPAQSLRSKLAFIQSYAHDAGQKHRTLARAMTIANEIMSNSPELCLEVVIRQWPETVIPFATNEVICCPKNLHILISSLEQKCVAHLPLIKQCLSSCVVKTSDHLKAAEILSQLTECACLAQAAETVKECPWLWVAGRDLTDHHSQKQRESFLQASAERVRHKLISDAQSSLEGEEDAWANVTTDTKDESGKEFLREVIGRMFWGSSNSEPVIDLITLTMQHYAEVESPQLTDMIFMQMALITMTRRMQEEGVQLNGRWLQVITIFACKVYQKYFERVTKDFGGEVLAYEQACKTFFMIVKHGELTKQQVDLLRESEKHVCHRLMVREMSHDVTETDLKDVFVSCGSGATKVKLWKDSNGTSKGKAFVDFADKLAADEAAKLAVLRGRKLRLEFSWSETVVKFLKVCSQISSEELDRFGIEELLFKLKDQWAAALELHRCLSLVLPWASKMANSNQIQWDHPLPGLPGLTDGLCAPKLKKFMEDLELVCEKIKLRRWEVLWLADELASHEYQALQGAFERSELLARVNRLECEGKAGVPGEYLAAYLRFCFPVAAPETQEMCDRLLECDRDSPPLSSTVELAILEKLAHRAEAAFSHAKCLGGPAEEQAIGDSDGPLDEERLEEFLKQVKSDRLDRWFHVFSELERRRWMQKFDDLSRILTKLHLQKAKEEIQAMQNDLQEGRLNAEALSKDFQLADSETPGLLQIDLHLGLLENLAEGGSEDGPDPLIAYLQEKGSHTDTIIRTLEQEGSDEPWINYLQEFNLMTKDWLHEPPAYVEAGFFFLSQGLLQQVPDTVAAGRLRHAVSVLRRYKDDIVQTFEHILNCNNATERYKSLIAKLADLIQCGTLKIVCEGTHCSPEHLLLAVERSSGIEQKDYSFLQELVSSTALMPSSQQLEADNLDLELVCHPEGDGKKLTCAEFFNQVVAETLKIVKVLDSLKVDGEPHTATIRFLSLPLKDMWALAKSDNGWLRQLEEDRSCLQRLLDSWRDSYSHKCKESKRLSLLRPKRLLSIIHPEVDAKEKDSIMHIRRCLWFCFPECHFSAFEAQFSWEAQCQRSQGERRFIGEMRELENCWGRGLRLKTLRLTSMQPVGAAEMGEHQRELNMDCDPINSALDAISRLLDLVGSGLHSEDTPQMGHKVRKSCYVLPDEDLQKLSFCRAWAMLSQQVNQMQEKIEAGDPELFEGKGVDFLHPCQIVRCTARTSWHTELKPLLTSPLGSRRLYILDVHQLAADVLHQLLSYERQDECEEENVERMYVFCANMADSDVVNSIMLNCGKLEDARAGASLQVDDAINLKKYYFGAKVQDLGRVPGIRETLNFVSDVQVFHGAPGSGKSERAMSIWQRQSKDKGMERLRRSLLVDQRFSHQMIIDALRDLELDAKTNLENPPETARQYSSRFGDDAVGSGHARSTVDSSQAWSAKRNQAGEWLQIDLGTKQEVVGTVIQGRADYDQWVSKYQVEYSIDGSMWWAVRDNNSSICHFKGTSDRSSKVRNFFPSPVFAQYIRFVVQDWFKHISMRAGVLVLQDVETSAGTDRQDNELCLHLDVSPNCSHFMLSDALVALMLQGMICNDDEVWTPSTRTRLTLQLELAKELSEDDASWWRTFCCSKIEGSTFDLKHVAQMRDGAIQPTVAEVGEWEAQMRNALVQASNLILNEDGNAPLASTQFSDDVPKLAEQLAKRLSLPPIDSTNYRQLSHFCRLLGIRYWYLCLPPKPSEEGLVYQFKLVVKECLIAVLGWAQPCFDDSLSGPGSGFALAKHGLFRQKLSLSFMDLQSRPYVRPDGTTERWEGISGFSTLHINFRREKDAEETQSSGFKAAWCQLEDVDWEDGVAGSTRDMDFDEIFKVAEKYRQCCRRLLATALDIDSGGLREILARQGYVLTADGVAKAWFLRERMRLGMNVVLSGHTGVGKTELISLLQTVFAARSNSKIYPTVVDRMALLREQVIALLLKPAGYTEAQALGFFNGDLYYGDQVDEALKHWANCQDSLDNWKAASVEFLKSMKKVADSLVSPSRNLRHEFSQENWLELFERGSPSEQKEILQKVCHGYLGAEALGVYFTELIHPGISRRRLHEIVQDAIDAAHFWQWRSKAVLGDQWTSLWPKTPECFPVRGSFQHVVLFLDELNTNEELLQEINSLMSDRLFKGQPLPPNLFCVGAVNPEKEDKTIFSVFPLPKPMEQLVVEFGELDDDTELKFLHSLFADESVLRLGQAAASADKREMLAKKLRLIFAEGIRESHKFVRREIEADKSNYATEDRMTECHIVSIRDMLRAIKSFNWLSREGFIADFLVEDQKVPKEQLPHWFAVIALFYTYAMRLPSQARRMRYLSECLEPCFTEIKKAEHQPWNRRVEKVMNELAKKVGDLTSEEFYLVTNQARGHTNIINYRIMNQNLFAQCMCMDMNIPLMLTSPPGHSKTFSEKLLQDVLAVPPDVRRSKFFQQRPLVSRTFTYQGSGLSTAGQITQLFSDARRHKHELLEQHRFVKYQRSVKAVIDEVGLIPGHILKCLHGVLDEGEVQSVLLSNQQLDAAKTNRMLQLRQFDLDEDSLKMLVSGALVGGASKRFKPHSDLYIVTGFVKFWTGAGAPEGDGIQQHPEWSKIFHLRDLLWLLRYLKRAEFVQYVDNELWVDAARILTGGLVRNFGLPTEKMANVINWAFDCILESLEMQLKRDPRKVAACKENFKSCFSSATANDKICMMQALRESLLDKVRPDEDLAHAAYRYIMIVDTTGNFASHSMLRAAFPDIFNSGTWENDHPPLLRFSLEDFAEGRESLDSHTKQRDQDMLSQVCQRMAYPGFCICTNFSRIAGSFYNVWNRNFIRMPQPEDRSLHPAYKAAVSIGASTSLKLVDPNFKFVIETPESVLNTEMACRNRCEKFHLSLAQVLDWRVVQMRSDSSRRRAISWAVEESETWARNMGGSITFSGFIENNTTPSAMLELLSRFQRLADHSNPWLAVSKEISGHDLLGKDLAGLDLAQQLAKMIKFMLTKLCRTQFASKASHRQTEIPHQESEFLSFYFKYQEHLDWKRFFKQQLDLWHQWQSQGKASEPAFSKKHVIYTQNSSVLAKAHDLEMQLGLEKEEVFACHLSKFFARSQCVERLQEFVQAAKTKPDKLHLFLLLVDIRSSNFKASRLSYVRSEIDNEIEKHSMGNVMVACVILPCARSEERGGYLQRDRDLGIASLWLDGWDFHYLDALGQETLESLPASNLLSFACGFPRSEASHLVRWEYFMELVVSEVKTLAQQIAPNRISCVKSDFQSMILQLQRRGLLDQEGMLSEQETVARLINRKILRAGLYMQPDAAEFERGLEKREQLFRRLFEWGDRFLLKTLWQEFDIALKGRGRRGGLLVQMLDCVCDSRQQADFGIAHELRESMQSQILSGVTFYVNSLCRTVTPELLKHDAGSLGSRPDVLKRILERSIQWLGIPDGRCDHDFQIFETPFFNQLVSGLSGLVQGASLGQGDTKIDTGAGLSVVRSTWLNVQSKIRRRANAQPELKSLLAEIGNDDTSKKLFCKDVISLVAPTDVERGEAVNEDFAVQWLLDLTSTATAGPGAEHVLFLFWFAKSQADIIVHLITTVKTFPPAILQHTDSPLIGHHLCIYFFDKLLEHDSCPLELQTAVSGAVALMFEALDSSRNEETTLGFPDLCLAFISASLLHLCLTELSLTTTCNDSYLKIVGDLRRKVSEADELSPEYIKLSVEALREILNTHASHSAESCQVASHSRVAALFFDAWGKALALLRDCEQSPLLHSTLVEQVLLASATTKDNQPAVLDHAGLHVVLTGPFFQARRTVSSRDFWKRVLEQADRLDLSDKCYDLVTKEKMDCTWQRERSVADVLGDIYLEWVKAENQLADVKEVKMVTLAPVIAKWKAHSSNPQPRSADLFQQGALRSAALSTLVEKLQRVDANVVHDECASLSAENHEDLRKFLSDPGARVQLFEQLGPDGQGRVMCHQGILEQLGLEKEVGELLQASSEFNAFAQNGPMLPWFQTLGQDTPEKVLKTCLSRHFEYKESSATAVSALKEYIEKQSLCRARFVLATVCYHVKCTSRSDESFELLADFIDSHEVRSLLQLDEKGPADQTRGSKFPDSDDMFRVSLLKALCAKDFGYLRHLFDEDQKTFGDIWTAATPMRDALACVMCFLAAAPVDTSFMHHRFFVMDPVDCDKSKLLAIGAYDARDHPSVSHQDCAFKNADHENVAIAPDAFGGCEEARRWGAMLTWLSSVCASLIIVDSPDPGTPWELDRLHACCTHKQVPQPKVREHCFNIGATFFHLLQEGLGKDLPAAGVVGNSIWTYLQLCESEGKSETSEFLTWEVRAQDAHRNRYEEFLLKSVYLPSKAETERRIKAGFAGWPEYVEWSSALQTRHRHNPSRTNLSAALRLVSQSDLELAQIFQDMGTDDDLAGISQLESISTYARCYHWVASMCSAFLTEEDLERPDLTVKDAKERIFEQVKDAAVQEQIENGFNEWVKAWNDCRSIQIGCRHETVPEMPHDLNFLLHNAATSRTYLRDSDAFPPLILKELTLVNNRFIDRLNNSTLGQQGKTFGRMRLNCEALAACAKNLTMRSLRNYGVQDLTPLFMTPKTMEAPLPESVEAGSTMQGEAFEFDVRGFTSFLVGRGLAHVATLPKDDSQSLQKWLSIDPRKVAAMWAEEEGGDDDGAWDSGQNTQRKVPKAVRRLNICIEFTHLEKQVNMLHELLKQMPGQIGFNADERDVQAMRSRLADLAPKSADFKDLAINLKDAVANLIEADIWQQGDNINLKHLRLMDFEKKHLAFGLGQCSPLEIPSIMTALVWLDTASTFGAQLPESTLSTLSFSARQQLEVQVREVFSSEPEARQRATANELAGWLSELEDKLIFFQQEDIMNKPLSEYEKELPALACPDQSDHCPPGRTVSKPQEHLWSLPKVIELFEQPINGEYVKCRDVPIIMQILGDEIPKLLFPLRASAPVRAAIGKPKSSLGNFSDDEDWV